MFSIDFIVLGTNRLPNAKSHTPIILGNLFLATPNALITCRNEMIKLYYFGNITLDLNIFNLRRQPDGFDDVDHSTLNWMGVFIMIS